MQCKECQRCSHGLPLEPTEAAQEHPSMWTLVVSKDSDLLQVTERIYKGKYTLAPSVFTHAQQEELIEELQRDLSGHLTRASLQGKKWPAELPSRGWRHY